MIKTLLEVENTLICDQSVLDSEAFIVFKYFLLLIKF